jgi:uncharacterized repeat protein (TIGR03803 family)
MKVRLMCSIPGGAAALLAVAVLAGTSRAGDLQVIASFDGDNGAAPTSTVTLDAQGDIFGTANGGGSGNVGTVWEIAAGTNTITTLASFQGTNGSTPQSPTLDSAGNLYGVTVGGGSANKGTVWEIAKGSSTITTLASFTGANGANPYGTVTVDSQGNVFGTTSIGGSNGSGTVWEIVKGSGTVTTLASFNNSNNTSAIPKGGVTVDAQGNLFGTTYNGGTGQIGTVWELPSGSHSIITLATFNGANGGLPQGAVTVASNGNIYGTAWALGPGGQGTVWELVKNTGTITVLGSFTNDTGGYPYGSVLVNSQGDVFGTAAYGGAGDSGTLWEIVKGSGTVTTLANFNTDLTGGIPEGGLTLNAQGDIVGTAQTGGTDGYGTVWEFTPNAVVPEPSSGVLASIGAAFVALVIAIKRRRYPPSFPFTFPTSH